MREDKEEGRYGGVVMENSQIEEPNYLDGRDVYEPVFDEDSQVGTGPGTDAATAARVDGAESDDKPV